MAVPPLTHHDIIRYAGPLSQRGCKVNLAACDKVLRYIEFQPQATDIAQCSQTYSLQIGKNNRILISRIIAHADGLLSTLSTIVSNMDAALDVFDQIETSRQLSVQPDHVIARSYSLVNEPGSANPTGSLLLRFACAQVAGIELRVDASTGGAMPADVRVLIIGKAASYLRDTLADGHDSPLLHLAARNLIRHAQSGNSTDVNPATAHVMHSVYKLPDDILAVLGPQWRPLVSQGDHWKGVLRQLGKGVRRTTRVESFVTDAIKHLSTTLSQSPAAYNDRHQQARWRVYFRRLQPVMLFIGILALMPISWLLVSNGGVRMHPLALGLTPLLMVGVVVLTSREIPVMEIPARPAPLANDFWSIITTQKSLPADE